MLKLLPIHVYTLNSTQLNSSLLTKGSRTAKRNSFVLHWATWNFDGQKTSESELHIHGTLVLYCVCLPFSFKRRNKTLFKRLTN